MSIIGLSLAAHKTVLIHFNNLNIPPGETSNTVNDCIIRSTETTRVLGVILDYKLTFQPQINELQKKKKIKKLSISSNISKKFGGVRTQPRYLHFIKATYTPVLITLFLYITQRAKF